MMKYTWCLISLLAFSTGANAEFNIENNKNQPTYIKLGYRNVLNSSFIYPDSDKNVNLKRNTVNIPYEDVLIVFQPLLKNDNKIKGMDYYFLNYECFVQFGGVKYKLPFIISDVAAVGASILFNDDNIVVFSVESYANPVSNNNSKKFKSDVYVLNKKNSGLYAPSFLSLNKKLKNLNDASMEFSKFISAKYDKNEKKYNILYEINNASEDFSSTGKVVYEKAPIEYSFILIPDQKKPFLIKNFSEKKKGSNNVISNDDRGGMYSSFLKKDID
ncbi:hypothetical protein F895_00107 [Acinetobacter sp. CIP 64.2]|uniref:hypothetical protein n=1 Tax=unclassified Acinetobacter TaxID=196816 RepID=UPI00028803E2|nr:MULTISPECIES: hypothetical protein [unclassified Acinetobacter]ENX18040.1 hypothetical protein F895_00107 [Acinetobacter sp. CIP 64.2]